MPWAALRLMITVLTEPRRHHSHGFLRTGVSGATGIYLLSEVCATKSLMGPCCSNAATVHLARLLLPPSARWRRIAPVARSRPGGALPHLFTLTNEYFRINAPAGRSRSCGARPSPAPQGWQRHPASPTVAGSTGAAASGVKVSTAT